MNIKTIKAELDRAIDYVLPNPAGFSPRRPQIRTTIKKLSKDTIIYTIKLK